MKVKNNKAKLRFNLQLLAGNGPEPGLTNKFVNATAIDFVSMFSNEITKLLEVLNIERRMVLSIGNSIKTYTSSVTLDGSTVEPGAVIPLSSVKTEEGDPVTLEWDKKRKAVTMEDIQLYGFDKAIVRTDNALKRELQKVLRKKLFKQLENGTGEASGNGLQAGLAKAWGALQVAFEEEDIRTVAFINPLDIADYIATANVTIQTQFGLNYLTNFAGIDTVIISNSIPQGKAYVTAADNLVLAYAPMGSGETSIFDMVTDETGIIGITHDIDKKRLTAETTTASAMVLFAERLDGVIKVDLKGGIGA